MGRPVWVLPDIDKGGLARCYLCVRHSLPDHVTKYITNIRDLEIALAAAECIRHGRRK